MPGQWERRRAGCSTDRGMTAETIEQLGFGYAPASREGLKTRLMKKGFPPALAIRSGLVAEREQGVLRRSVPEPADHPDRAR